MKKTIFFLLLFLGILAFFFFSVPKTSAQTVVVTPTPELCEGGCPSNTNCGSQDVWVRDDEVTALWKGGERSRQFVYWVLTHPSIDNHPTLLWIWGLSRNIVYFLLLITAIFMGIGIIISQRSNFNLKIEVGPLFIKLFLLLLYTTFSATIVLFIIQISDIMMQFFIKTLGGNKLFNIFGIGTNSEDSYRQFVGCRNVNRNNWEMVRTSMFLIRFTNMTYYIIGIMLILRKVILWFLMIVSPFLAILMPYVFIRNIGWIWVGVFFQWVFYGPLFGLFLGGLAKIWNSKDHIPFIFDFSRRNKLEEIVYPTSINILYGGPAQKLEILNTSNYVDTFAEYIISLIMLWTVIFLPWWLLRIFRDYCCEGIYAAKNILMAMYDTLKTGGLPPSGPTAPAPSPTAAGMAKRIPEEREVVTKIKLETVEEIKRARTEDIHRVMNISVRKLTDVARFETNKELRQTVTKNIEHLQNPMKAETPTERQRYMNIRAELFDRAIRGDALAKQTLTSISTAEHDRLIQQEKILKTVPQMTPVARTISVKVGLPQNKTISILKSIFNTASSYSSIVNSVASQTNTSSSQVQSILNSLTQSENLNQPGLKIIENVSNQTAIDKEKVKEVIDKTTYIIKHATAFNQILDQKKITEKQAAGMIEGLPEAVKEPEKKKETLVKVVSVRADLPQEETTPVLSFIFKTLSQENTFVNTLANETNTSSSQVQSILNSLTQSENLNQPGLKIIENVSNQTAIDKEKVKLVIEQVPIILKRQRQFLKEVTGKEQVEDKVVEKTIDSLFPLVAKPEENIEKNISIPPTVSLEDYEEVKNMWFDQYEKGEVPVSEDIKDRYDWLQTDIVVITNILNNLLSSDEKLRARGLEDVGYILPLFMINNLKGEELVVYLKAKLEAAKQVKRQLEKEEEIKKKVKEKEEEVLVEAPKAAKKEEEKVMEMKEELKIQNY